MRHFAIPTTILLVDSNERLVVRAASVGEGRQWLSLPWVFES